MSPRISETNWRSVAEQASTEMDPGKLATLTSELFRLLDLDDVQKSIRTNFTAHDYSP
jgi:hypothetical protein